MRLSNLAGILFLFIFLAAVFSFTAFAENVSLLSCDLSKWTSIDATFKSTVSKATVIYSDGVLKFGNTRGLWPGMKYDFEEKFKFNLETDRIVYDFTPGINTNIIICFLDSKGDARFVYINPAVAGALLDSANSEIMPSLSPLKGALSLGELKTGHYDGKTYSGDTVWSYADSGKNIEITGIQIDIIGSSKKTVDFRTLAVQRPDRTTETSGSTCSAFTTTKTKKSKTQAVTSKSFSGRPSKSTSAFNTASRETASLAAQTQTEQTSPADTETAEKTAGASGTITANKVGPGILKKEGMLVPAAGAALFVATLVYFKKSPQNPHDE